jgi:hypothetical protein
MTDTAQLRLPLVQPAQAQKHVTVNDALTRLDGLVNLRLVETGQTTPPAVVDGNAYGVAPGATGDWFGEDGNIAIASNGGWVFVTPKTGWRAWSESIEQFVTFTGLDWDREALARSANGAATQMSVIEFDHAVTAGVTNTTTVDIPANSMVVGVSGRVTSTLTGTLSAWQMGVAGDTSRFGSGMGVPAGSYATGLLGSPSSVYSDTGIVLTAVGGDFAGGTVRIAIHVLQLQLPSV